MVSGYLFVDDIGVNEIMLVENAVEQTFVSKGDRLFYFQLGSKRGSNERR